LTKANFIVRVYGVCVDEQRRVLLSDEYVFGRSMTKFPGGGLEYGEGTRDCLERELLEETGLKFEVLDHFYTTDFFVLSGFHDGKQLISIYYFVSSSRLSDLEVSTTPFDFKEKLEGAQQLRWKRIEDLTEKDLTFPVDQRVVQLLKKLPGCGT